MPAFRHRHSLSLEVTTESLHADLEIISPTPRAFTFPINSQDRPPLPSSTPLHFGVERDLHLPSTPGPHRGWSPSPSESSSATFSSHSTFSTSSFSSSPSTPASASGRRRKSSAVSPDGTSASRPKKGDEDYVKRPENAFILFRRKCCEDRISTRSIDESTVPGAKKKQRQADLSKTISQQWKDLSPAEKHEWEQLAKEKKREHEKAHPGYVYRPQRKVTKRELKKDGTEDLDGSGSFMVQISAPTPPTRISRSAMGPTPPPFQTMLDVSNDRSPTSPGFVPQIARRPSQTDLSPDQAQYEFESHGTTFVQPSGFPQENATFGAAPFEKRPFFAGRGRSQSLHLTMPSFDLESRDQLLPSVQIFSPSSDSSASPVSPPETSPYSPEATSPFTPLDAITGPFSQFGMASPFETSPSAAWGFSQPGFNVHSPQEEHPTHPLDAMPFQPVTTWEDVSLWEGDERFEMSTALCEIGLPPPLEEEDLPLGAEFMNLSGAEEPSFEYPEEMRFASEYSQPVPYDADQSYASFEPHTEQQYPTYQFIPYLASP